jgi:hypothetical protein
MVVVAGVACAQNRTPVATIAGVAEDGTVCVQVGNWLGGSRATGGTIAPAPVPRSRVTVHGMFELTSDSDGVFTPDGGGPSVSVFGNERPPDQANVSCAIR